MPFLPTEFVVFADMGAAWTENQSVDWTFDPDSTARVPVFSAGVSARMLIGGILPIQFSYSFPFQRPLESSGVFTFTFTPGW